MRRTGLSNVRIVVLSLPLRLLFPTLFIRSLSKRAVGFAFLRDESTLFISIAFLLVYLAFSYVMSLFIGPLSYIVFFWLHGTTGFLMLLNSITPGFIFVKPNCSDCRLKAIIARHELSHLNGTFREEEIWKSIREEFRHIRLDPYSDPSVCEHCPIPRRLNNKN